MHTKLGEKESAKVLADNALKIIGELSSIRKAYFEKN